MSTTTTAALRGIKWTTAVAVATALLQVGYTSCMARLLSPGAFGLVALAGVVLRFGTYFAGLGLDRALVQRPTLHATDVRASFAASLATGVAVAAVFWGLAPLAVLILKDAGVVPLIRGLALGFVASAWGLPAASLLRRAMRFETLAKIEISCYILSYGGVGLGSAWLGAGVWSLVAANVSQLLFNSIATYAVVRHPLRPVRQWQPYRELLGYGSQVSLISFQEFVIGSLDTVLIGRQLGPAPLGFYNRAYMLVYLPMYFLTNSVGRVAFPAFSQVQADLPRLRELYQRSCTLVAALVLPLCAGVAVAAPELVRVMLGPKWAPSGPVLSALCLAIPLAMVNTFGVITADVRANLRRKLWLNVQFGGLLVALFWLLRGQGIVGVALAVGLAEVGRTGLYMRLTHRDIGLGYGAQLRQYVPGLRNAVGVALAIAGATWGLRPVGLPPLALFGTQLLAGAVALVVVLLAWPLPELHAPLAGLLARAQAYPRLPAWLGPGLRRYAARLAPTAVADTTDADAEQLAESPALVPG